MSRKLASDLELVGGARLLGQTFTVGFEFDGGGAALTTDAPAARRGLDRAFKIVGYRIIGDASGSAEFQLRGGLISDLPFDSGDNLVASAPPTISTARAVKSTTLTGWSGVSTALPVDTVLEAALTSVSGFEVVTLELLCVRAA